MAEPVMPLLIDSNRITLTPQSAVNYQLQWSSIDPQQLATQKVVIILDATNTPFDVTLPPLSDEQSQNVQFFFTIIGLGDNAVAIHAADGDVIARSPDAQSLQNGKNTSISFLWLIKNNWNYIIAIG